MRGVEGPGTGAGRPARAGSAGVFMGTAAGSVTTLVGRVASDLPS
jgi:hypothetical protein